jgi:hypothetical protein
MTRRRAIGVPLPPALCGMSRSTTGISQRWSEPMSLVDAAICKQVLDCCQGRCRFRSHVPGPAPRAARLPLRPVSAHVALRQVRQA